jgi:predicted double-glycine peptidase
MNSGHLEKIIQLVKGQTNYTEDEIKEKLSVHNNDYLAVIKEYMGITKETSSYEKANSINTHTSVNQKIYSNIRTFMDNNMKQYEIRKKIVEQNKYSVNKD